MSNELPGGAGFRAPSIPLVAHDPYFSIWCPADALTDADTTHWTGSAMPLRGLVRVDGTSYRWLGAAPALVPAVEQLSVDILPTRTVVRSIAGPVALTVEFCSPALPHDLDLLSRPVTYVTASVQAVDGSAHRVELLFTASAMAAVDRGHQEVAWSRLACGELGVARVGTTAQPVLARSGDDLRIDWGHLMVAATGGNECLAISRERHALDTFIAQGTLPSHDTFLPATAPADRAPILCVAGTLDTVDRASSSVTWLIAYDDQWSLEYLNQRLRPYWRRDGDGPVELLEGSWQARHRVRAECARFDDELMADLEATGGAGYARLAALAFRQCLSANKLAADFEGKPLMFPKENFSNGCIGTVDVHYPASPFFLLFSPSLLRAQLDPVLEYAESGRWPWPFAPHDLGTYPHANGQVYGGGETGEQDQMPVEECGNMLLMVCALARAEASPWYALDHWPILRSWADYLVRNGMDPALQLCTDDFAGHLARNANLSMKAIVALGAFARVARMAQHEDDAAHYGAAASRMAAQWMEMARAGDHTCLAFGKPETWSQKYNLVWDRLLDLGLFPASLAEAELATYRAKQERYGLPLDSRRTYTKLDWIVWTATLTGSREDLDALVEPLVLFASETPDRVPLTDWFETTDATVVGFRARSVVGGIYIPLLGNADLWSKWSARGTAPVVGSGGNQLAHA